MNQKQPPAPEAISFEEADKLLQSLWHITQKILPLSTGDDLPALNQLILERSQLVEACRQIAASQFEPKQQKQLDSQLAQCKSLDTQIESNMRSHQDKIDKQLKHLQQSKQLLGKYQPGNIDEFEAPYKDA